MIIDGRVLSETLQKELAERVAGYGKKLTVALIVSDDSPVTRQYVQKKVVFGELIGVEVVCAEFSKNVSEQEIVDVVRMYGSDDSVHGIVVQLPLPKDCVVEQVLSHIPPEKDIDALLPESPVLPPVVEAVRYIAEKNNVSFVGKKVAVIGNGRLVGAPAYAWVRTLGCDVVQFTRGTLQKNSLIDKDIIITGAGSPGLITPDMVKDGVSLFDAGTSTQTGTVRGDCDPACADKAGLFTPVPGGIGPLTIALLFKNLLDLNNVA